VATRADGSAHAVGLWHAAAWRQPADPAASSHKLHEAVVPALWVLL